ncbi:hypothetical protein [Mesobacillus zeae]|uniref:Uncharacterized protein n=1 Tax=Mesobacillus zeae TaxID=1917180 RepID=A0A398BFM7_9BACI|nr:hypothetical protein [Mesobacillus zeae]RID88832.1 hypothetical protein D1970_00880 [Mesobacillus zeae]
MVRLDGQIISGIFDDRTKEFEIEKVKDFYTKSIIKKNQVDTLYHYLKLHEDDQEGQIITMYDQIPVLLTQGEIKRLLRDLEQVKSMYQ